MYMYRKEGYTVNALAQCCLLQAERLRHYTSNCPSWLQGLSNRPSLDNLYKLVKAPLNHKTDFERQLVRRAIEGSYSIWCSRNMAF